MVEILIDPSKFSFYSHEREEYMKVVEQQIIHLLDEHDMQLDNNPIRIVIGIKEKNRVNYY